MFDATEVLLVIHRFVALFPLTRLFSVWNRDAYKAQADEVIQAGVDLTEVRTQYTNAFFCNTQNATMDDPCAQKAQ